MLVSQYVCLLPVRTKLPSVLQEERENKAGPGKMKGRWRKGEQAVK